MMHPGGCNLRRGAHCWYYLLALDRAFATRFSDREQRARCKRALHGLMQATEWRAGCTNHYPGSQRKDLEDQPNVDMEDPTPRSALPRPSIFNEADSK
jgi:hypothetical protein